MSLPKSSLSLWEQYPLASGCPNFKGRNGERKCTKTEFISSVISARTRSTSPSRRQTANTQFFRWRLSDRGRGAWNGLGEYVAAKLRKGDHIYVEGTLVSSTYEKEFGKGKAKVTVPLKAWQVKANSIRKLNRARKDQVPDNASLDAQPEEVPF